MPSRDLLILIEDKMPKLSKGQKRIANYLLSHYEKAVLLTASKLGEATGVSESTVVRFAAELGFEGYPELQKALRNAIKNKLTSKQRMAVTTDILYKDSKKVLQSVLKDDVERINNTLNQIDEKAFNLAVESILNARKVYIVGNRASASLASYFHFYLNMILDEVVLVNSGSTSDVFEQIFRISNEDTLIAISFPRYSLGAFKAIEYAYNQKASTIAITDNTNSPIAKFGKHNLIARTGMVSFIDSMVSPMSVISAMLTAISVRRKEQLYKNFDMLEEIWQDYQVYSIDSDFEGED